MSPKIWQLAQAESPWLELNEASYKKRRPLTTCASSGLYIATPPISVLVCVSIILIALSKRVSTYRRALLSSSSTPVGPPPLSRIWLAVSGVKVSFSSAVVL
jgi:hypothetical protein